MSFFFQGVGEGGVGFIQFTIKVAMGLCIAKFILNGEKTMKSGCPRILGKSAANLSSLWNTHLPTNRSDAADISESIRRTEWRDSRGQTTKTPGIGPSSPSVFGQIHEYFAVHADTNGQRANRQRPQWPCYQGDAYS